MKTPKILVVVTKYPSASHPYIIRLMAALKKHYPGLRLFMFRPGERAAGEAQVGKEQVDHVLSDAFMRGQPRASLKVLGKAMLNVFKNPGRAISTYKQAGKNGLTPAQSAGQVFYHQEILGEKFDLVYFNAVQIAYHFDIPFYFPDTEILISCRGDDFDLHPVKYDDTLRKADHVHVLGNYLKKQAIERGINEEDITIIPPAFLKKWPSREHFGYEQPALKITMAARLSWTKGHRYVLEAIAQLKKMLPETPLQLHIMGTGEAEEELRYRVKMLGLEENVIFHGWMQEQEVIHHIKNSFVYCLPSLVEGFNNSVVTAQSLGVPCIVGEAGGLPENVIHNETGLVVPTCDGKAIAEAVRSLWEDRENYARLGANAVERVKELDFEIHLSKYIAMFDKVLEQADQKK